MTPEQLDEILDKIVASNGDLSVLSKDELKLKIKIVGESYHCSITGEVARSLWMMQNDVYKAYAKIKYNSNVRKLTQEERRALAITFDVEDGCVLVSFDKEGLIKEFIPVLSSMDSAHMLAAICCFLFCGTTVYGFKYYFDYLKRKDDNRKDIVREEVEKERIRADVERTNQIISFAQSIQQRAMPFERVVTDGAKNLAKVCVDADSVTVNDGEMHFSREDIRKLNERSKNVKALQDEEAGVFYVRGYEVVNDYTQLTLINATTNKKQKARLSPQLKLGEGDNVTYEQIFKMIAVNKGETLFVKFNVTGKTPNKTYEIISIKKIVQ